MARSKPDQDAEECDDQAARDATIDRLYRRYAGWLGRVLASRLRATPVEIDDLVQDTYIRAARYTPEDASRQPKALLLKIAVNLARDHMRRNVVRGGLDRADPDETEMLAVAADQHQIAQLKEVILALPPIFRDVFVLHRFTGLTYEEIASHVGISVKTVEWRMSRALAMCVERLKD